jgi:hypothetical protein
VAERKKIRHDLSLCFFQRYFRLLYNVQHPLKIMALSCDFENKKSQFFGLKEIFHQSAGLVLHVDYTVIS